MSENISARNRYFLHATLDELIDKLNKDVPGPKDCVDLALIATRGSTEPDGIINHTVKAELLTKAERFFVEEITSKEETLV